MRGVGKRHRNGGGGGTRRGGGIRIHGQGKTAQGYRRAAQNEGGGKRAYGDRGKASGTVFPGVRGGVMKRRCAVRERGHGGARSGSGDEKSRRCPVFRAPPCERSVQWAKRPVRSRGQAGRSAWGAAGAFPAVSGAGDSRSAARRQDCSASFWKRTSRPLNCRTR